MPSGVELHAAAQAELAEAAGWYAEREPAAAVRFVDVIAEALETIGAMPLAFPLIAGGAGARRMRIRRFPYVLIYVTSPSLVVLAIAHTRRKPGYWRKRA